jgi:hypothetical protein
MKFVFLIKPIFELGTTSAPNMLHAGVIRER